MEKDSWFAEEAEPPDGCSEQSSSVSIRDRKKIINNLSVSKIKKKYSTIITPLARLPKFKISSPCQIFRKKFFPKASCDDWNNWHWQVANRITDIDTLGRIINLSDEEYSALIHYRDFLSVNITPYYASLIDGNNPLDPLRKAVVPVYSEYIKSSGEYNDPLGEDNQSPVPGLIHRYPDRVLFLVTDFCSTHCRYCTRARMVGQGEECNISRWEMAIDYIRDTPSVRDVLISGGDPLTLSDENLEWLLSKLRQISHVEFIRIGTKVPAVLPQRITPALTRMLKRYHPLWISVHFMHPIELTHEVCQACNRLADAGIPLGSQTVLLSGINDNLNTMKELMHGLLKIRVRPYYLYQCDPISGSSHFRTSVRKGLDIIKGLRGYTSGYAVPAYVIDAPGGGGKIPLLPEYVAGHDDNCIFLKNYEGNIYSYPDPINA